MAKHHPDLVMCRKQPGVAVGRLCDKCDGKCVICDSFVNPQTLVHICDECNYGSYEGRCVVCGNAGTTDAYYCRECVQQEKDRDGCPKIVNLGAVSEKPWKDTCVVVIHLLVGPALVFGSSLFVSYFCCFSLIIFRFCRRKQIFFMNEKNMGLKRDSICTFSFLLLPQKVDYG